MKNLQNLKLHVPQPCTESEGELDFARLRLDGAGDVRRPDVFTAASEITDLANRLIRVLDDDGAPVGPWNPMLSPDVTLRALRCMMLTRAYDERMYRYQRQGKTPFYMQCTGEEAIAVAQAFALQPDDMCFPTYRQQGLLIARDYPIVDMMCQVFGNSRDPMKGRQLPVFYSSRDHGFFSISGNLGTQFSQAVGWAMASAYSSDNRIAAAWIGEGATAEGDFHYGMTFAAVYHAPVILNIVNNQWAISTFQGIAGGEEATFASRGIGYGIPALRVDGNDFLAVYAATQWASERARLNRGPTVIELFTYRVAAHSSSDDPTRYRSKNEVLKWPLGDPIDRLKEHLIAGGTWSEEQHQKAEAELAEIVRAAGKEAESFGTTDAGPYPSAKTMFDDVYKALPWHLHRQRQELGV